MTIYGFKIVWETPRDNAERRLSGTRNQRRQILFEMVDILHGCALIKATFHIHRNTFLPCGSLCDVIRRNSIPVPHCLNLCQSGDVITAAVTCRSGYETNGTCSCDNWSKHVRTCVRNWALRMIPHMQRRRSCHRPEIASGERRGADMPRLQESPEG